MKTLWFALSMVLIGSWSLAAGATTVPHDLQSPHPYPNHLDELYFVEAPEGASAFTIHFAWVDLEEDYDFLYVRDSQGNVIETLTGFHNDFTVEVPGPQAALNLVTDYSVTRQGFVVDALVYEPSCDCVTTIWAPVCGENGETYGSTCWAECDGVDWLYVGQCVWRDVDLTIETVHPYGNDEDQVWTVQAPEPTTLYELAFEEVDLEEGYDFLRISNMGRLVAALTGDLGPQVVVVPFDEVRLHFQSDYSVTRWGFRMTGYRYLDLDGEEEPVPDCRPTGCSGQICAAEDVITTCEWADYYACYQLPDVAMCGYDEVAGECAWMDAAPDSLAQCMNQAALGVGINETCGTIMGKVCDPGLTCNYAGDYPDAGGTCEELGTWHTRLVDVSSPHPYANDFYDEYAITVVGAERIRAHFSDFATEHSYDGVTLRGPSGTWWTGDLGEFWTPEVEGDTLELELETDYSITDHGFDIDRVEYYR